jgi:hypothetical protein
MVTLALAVAVTPAFAASGIAITDGVVPGAATVRTSLNPQPEPPGTTGPWASAERYCLDCEPNLPG